MDLLATYVNVNQMLFVLDNEQACYIMRDRMAYHACDTAMRSGILLVTTF